MPSSTNRTDARSMRRTTGRSAPAISSPLPQPVEWYRSPPRLVGLERGNAFRRHENASEVGAVLTAAMEIAATGGHELVAHAQTQTLRGERRRVRGVVALDAQETSPDELRQQAFETLDGAGMRERRDAAVLAHERDRFERCEPDARDVRGRVLADERVERAVVGRHVAGLEERLRQMGPPECPTLRDLAHPIERDRVSEAVQLLHHQLESASAVLAQPAEPYLERVVLRIDEIREYVDVSPLGFGVQLGRGDHANAAALALRDRLRHAEQRVVVREGLDANATGRGANDELCRCERAVRCDRMRVQIDRVTGAHPRLLIEYT